MQLFHGTTQSRAESILAEGFRRFDCDREMKAIATRYSVSQAALRADLEGHGRFSAFRSDDRYVYLTTGREHAASYASRAPEAEWECLWAVYRIHHPHLGADWNQSDDGHYWVLTQQEHDRPVVVAVDADVNGLSVTSNAVELLGSQNGIEVRLDVAADRYAVSAIEPTDRWVDGSLLRFITGLGPNELRAQVQSGVWKPTGVYRADPYWHWTQVKGRLSPERLSALRILASLNPNV